jgi:nitrate/TMAO reductase-like tetraheme cytochrome c subunit
MRRLLLLAFAGTSLALPALAEDPAPDQAPVQLEISGKTLKADGADWHERAGKWFDSDDKKARKEQMRAATRAIKQGCKYCHTQDFEGFTDKKLIAQQMMWISKTFDTKCGDCHAGKDLFTPLGKRAHKMFALSVERGVTCDHCHSGEDHFKGLTPDGKKQKDEWAARAAGKAPAAEPPAAPMSAP